MTRRALCHQLGQRQRPCRPRHRRSWRLTATGAWIDRAGTAASSTRSSPCPIGRRSCCMVRLTRWCRAAIASRCAALLIVCVADSDCRRTQAWTSSRLLVTRHHGSRAVADFRGVDSEDANSPAEASRRAACICGCRARPCGRASNQVPWCISAPRSAAQVTGCSAHSLSSAKQPQCGRLNAGWRRECCSRSGH